MAINFYQFCNGSQSKFKKRKKKTEEQKEKNTRPNIKRTQTTIVLENISDLWNQTAVSDHHGPGKLVPNMFLWNDPDHIQSFNNLAKHDVYIVKFPVLRQTDHKLRFVGVRTTVVHGDDTRTGVLLFDEVLILRKFGVVQMLFNKKNSKTFGYF